MEERENVQIRMCGWRHSESPLICPCLLSPWSPLTLITVWCVVVRAAV